MSMKKNFFAILCVLGINNGYAASNDLTIVNHTQFDSTSIINNGPCSTLLGDIGVTHAGKTNVIPQIKVAFACLVNAKECKADVYMTSYCNQKGDKPVAQVILDTKNGVQKVDVFDKNYQLSATGFNLVLSGGPHSAAN